MGTRPQTRLDEIHTEWSLLRLARTGRETSAGRARNVLALRYAGAIRRYIGAQVPSEPDADELAQEVLVRILRGSFFRATPERGRFRDLLKAAVRNVVRTYWSRKHRRATLSLDAANVAIADRQEMGGDESWNAACRQQLLRDAWRELELYERNHPGSLAYTVLRLRADHPEQDSVGLAARLAELTGRVIDPQAVRQQLHRARTRFARILFQQVADAQDEPTRESIREELREIGLLEYLRDFLPAEPAALAG